MKHLLALLFCSISFAAYSQLTKDSMLIDGHYRYFQFNKPVANGQRSSLLFVMHGSGGSGSNIMKQTGKLEAISEREKLLLVYPDGYLNYWNECRKYASSAANKEDINEQVFFRSMISYFSERYGINTRQVFAAGFSGGGHMAYKLGLTMPGEISAIAAVVANMPDSASSDCMAAGKPLPVLIINGTLDGTNPYNGGEMFVNGSSYGVVRSSENSFAYWWKLAGYTGGPVKKQLPDLDTADHRIIESYRYQQAGKPRVELLKVIGGKHDYPGDIDVYLYAWDFFKSVFQPMAIHTADPSKPVLVVGAACGQCRLGLPGKGCDLAVQIDGKAYFVDGTDIDSHGDAHARDGFCETIRKASVQGELVNDRFVVTYFKLVEPAQ